MSSNVVDIKVKYDITGLNESIRGTQRLLYLTNAVRLSIKDAKMTLEDPSFQNIMWTSIQLTRVWRHLYFLIMKAKKEATGFAGADALIGIEMRNLFGEATTRDVLRGRMWATLAMPGVPLAVGAGLGGLAIGVGYYMWNRRTDTMREKWLERQTDIAKMQGLTP